MKNTLTEVQQILSRNGKFTRWLAVEKALANAQGKLGIIPAKAAKQIDAKASVACLAIDQYDAIYEKTGHPMVSLLRLLEAAVGLEAGQYIHLGATTQDIIDTATVLAIKRTIELTEEKLDHMVQAAAGLAEKYANTPMIGRTHNVQALPITFGYKAAIWASELNRCMERIHESRERILVIQLSGAVGSMVSFGTDGPKIQKLMAEELGLGEPDICWHASRDRFAEFAADMSLVGTALGRIAQEVYLLMGTEYGELSEYWGDGRVGSSTMPHKVNPTSTQHMIGRGTALRYLSAQIQELALVDHERNMQHSIEEERALEEICMAVAELMDRGQQLLETLVVNEDNMLRNLKLLGGLTQSEHIMLELGKTIGKQNAHRVVTKIAVDAFKNHLNFEEELIKNHRITEALGEDKIHDLLDPMKYIGLCPQMAMDIAKKLKRNRE
jgi:adenylosuccinate lyase